MGRAPAGIGLLARHLTGIVPATTRARRLFRARSATAPVWSFQGWDSGPLTTVVGANDVNMMEGLEMEVMDRGGGSTVANEEDAGATYNVESSDEVAGDMGNYLHLDDGASGSFLGLMTDGDGMGS